MDSFVRLIPEDNDCSDTEAIKEARRPASALKSYKRANTNPDKRVSFKLKPQSRNSVNSITTDEEFNS